MLWQYFSKLLVNYFRTDYTVRGDYSMQSRMGFKIPGFSGLDLERDPGESNPGIAYSSGETLRET